MQNFRTISIVILALSATPTFAQDVKDPYDPVKLSYEQTKSIENGVRSAFLNSEEVRFRFQRIPGRQDDIVVKVIDKAILKEFANSFRFLNEATSTRIPENRGSMSLAITLTVAFSGNTEYSLIFSPPNLHSVIVVGGDEKSTVFFDTDLSLDSILVFHYYFEDILKQCSRSRLF